MFNIDLVSEMFLNHKAATIDERISPKDAMNNQWYFNVGRSAVHSIGAAIMACKLQAVNRILDIPCGHGRVYRHLVHLFPGAALDACDLDSDAVDFCVQSFGGRAIYSREELTEVHFDSLYDIIWVGSLFTHTSEDVTKRYMAHLSKFLTPHGVIVATLHGRWSQHVHKVAPFIAEDIWAKILEGYNTTGYGYQDYPREKNHSYIKGSYGISLVKPHVTIRNLEDIPGIRLYLYMERCWSDVHDVVVFGRPSFDEPWPVV